MNALLKRTVPIEVDRQPLAATFDPGAADECFASSAIAQRHAQLLGERQSCVGKHAATPPRAEPVALVSSSRLTRTFSIGGPSFTAM